MLKTPALSRLPLAVASHGSTSPIVWVFIAVFVAFGFWIFWNNRTNKPKK